MSNPVEQISPAPARSHFVARAGRRLHLLEWKAEQPVTTVLAIHGGCANAHWWFASAGVLARSHRVLALDLAGHGESDPIADGRYSLESHRDDVLHVARELDLRDFALMGHSFGGFVSLAALPALEARIGALILVDSRGHIRRRSARYLQALAKFPSPQYSSEKEARRAFQLLPRDNNASDEIIDHVARHSIRQANDGSWSLAFDRRALRAAEERNFDTEIGDWHGPTLLIRGAESTALSERALGELASEMVDAESVQVDGAHHHVMLDQPGPFAAVVDEFLTRRLSR